MNVDVEIYLNQFIAFFDKNPNELIMLIGDVDKNIFYEKVKKQSINNVEKGDDPSLTRNQIIEILVDIRKGDGTIEEPSTDEENVIYQLTKFGKIFLN